MRRTMRSDLSAVLGTLVSFGFFAGCNAVLNNPPGETASEDAGSPQDSSIVIVTEDAGSFDDAFDAGASTFDATVIDAAATGSEAGVIPTCSLGDKLCNAACVGADDPFFGCGPLVCSACALDHATSVCSASGCAIGACESGYADCDQKPANGCETDLSQAAHCGACNAACGSTAPDCVPTTTGFACATGCGSAAPTLCVNQCVDLSTSLDHCGQCSASCASVTNGTAACSSGHCGFTCDTSFHSCASACDSNLSASTCGASCSPFPAGPNAVATCNGVQCGIACEAGFADCDGAPGNGCEVDLLTSASSCGQCGHSCDGGTCANAVCSAPPTPDAGASQPDSSAPLGDAASAPGIDAGNDASSVDSSAPTMDAAVSD